MTRRASRVVAGLGSLAVVALGGRELIDAHRALGASRTQLNTSAARAAAAGSTRIVEGVFHNTLPDELAQRGSALYVLRTLLARGPGGRPAHAVPLVAVSPPAAAAPLAATWYGHASVLLEIDGTRILADPVWATRASPVRRFGPRRLFPPPVPVAELPPIDAILISHDHYDHLDMPTIQLLLKTQSAPFVVPLGVGEHLRRWGAPDARIIELDWGQAANVRSITLTCAEARHFSGRGLARNTTLWASWAIKGSKHRAFVCGDTGYTPAFRAIAADQGPFDLTVLPIGSYGQRWPHIHMTPEEAVKAHQDLTDGSHDRPPGLMLPVHWATFNMGLHTWSEPAHRVVVAAEKAGVPLAMPRPGERVDAAAPDPLTDWWSPISH